MVRTEHDIVRQVSAAKDDPEAADALIEQYLGFIRSETVKFTHAAPEDGHEDELSIAMMAFYESILSYERSRGAFLSYAARAIRNRLIDHYRVERRHRGLLSLHAPAGGEEDHTLLDVLPDHRDALEERTHRTASQAELQAFSAQLAGFGITLSAVADSCPRQERTMTACRRVLDYARSHPELLERLAVSGRLPVNELALAIGIDRKTLERHRKYLIAILLAFTNGYEIIRGHLRQLAPAGQGGIG